MPDVKVISIRQPWAAFVISGRKGIECRNWSPQIIKPGERLYIHASGKVDKRALRRFQIEGLITPPAAGWDIETLGAILGYVIYKGVRTYKTEREFYSDSIFHLCHPNMYAPTKYGLMLDWPIRFREPLFKPGKLGIFTIPARIVEGRAEYVPEPKGKLSYPDKENHNAEN